MVKSNLMLRNLERLIAKLDNLRCQDKHRYELRLPIAPDRLAEVENKLGQALPDGYRMWVTQVCDGGPGPDYGLLPVAKDDIFPIDLEADFPYTSDKPFVFDAELMGSGTENDPFKLDDLLQGFTFLTEIGCGRWYILIPRGEATGQVWLFTDEFSVDPLVVPETGQPFDFLTWYETWLDRALAGQSFDYLPYLRVSTPKQS